MFCTIQKKKVGWGEKLNKFNFFSRKFCSHYIETALTFLGLLLLFFAHYSVMSIGMDVVKVGVSNSSCFFIFNICCNL